MSTYPADWATRSLRCGTAGRRRDELLRGHAQDAIFPRRSPPTTVLPARSGEWGCPYRRQSLGEVVGRDVHLLMEVEAVRVVPLHAGVQVEHRATGRPGPGYSSFGQQRVTRRPIERPSEAVTRSSTYSFRMANARGEVRHPATPHAPARRRTPNTGTGVPADDPPRRPRPAGLVQVRSQLPQHRQHVRHQPRIPGLQVHQFVQGPGSSRNPGRCRQRRAGAAARASITTQCRLAVFASVRSLIRNERCG